MAIQLRPHHLLCVLTFKGKGYTPAFVENYETIVDRLNSGETIEIIDGPDALCGPMLDEPECHCRNESVSLRDRQALDAVRDVLSLPTGTTRLALNSTTLARLRAAFKDGRLRQACKGCEWESLCSAIAQKEFRGCRFQLPLP